MISIEKKFIRGKPFFYLTEQFRIGSAYKKIQVYLGKSIPNKLSFFYQALAEKEIKLISDKANILFAKEKLDLTELIKIEKLRVRWKYFELQMTNLERERFWRKFAIQFIFESNAIEGSRLSEKEVSSIVKNQNIKKSLGRKEIQEVVNSLKSFEYLKQGKFRLNQRTIISFHTLLLKNLGVSRGYKKVRIVVNNKETTAPGNVRHDMAKLLAWFNTEKKKKRCPLLVFADFHQRFERIHPFEDGNGRIGRLFFNWMLLKASYPPILFKKKNRESYFHALDQADEGRNLKWYRHVIAVYKRTSKEFI